MILKSLTWQKIIFFLLALLFIFLTFYKLGENALWHDEAEVAMLGKSVLSTGLPIVKYQHGVLPIGNNDLFYLNNPPYLFSLQTWLMYYLAAFSQSLFGSTLFGVRALFAVFGVISLLLFYKLAKLISGSYRIAIISTLLLGFSIQYILLIRQARYYTPVFFFSLLSIYLFIKFLRISQDGNLALKYLVGFSLALMGLFYSHYLSFYSLLPGFIIFYFADYLKRGDTQKNKGQVTLYFLVSLAVVMFMTTPFLLYLRREPINIAIEDYWPTGLLDNIIELIKKVNRQIPFIFFTPGIYYSLTGNKIKEATKSNFRLIFLLLLSALSVVSFLTFLRIPPSVFPDLRYILVAYPIFFIFAASYVDLLINKIGMLAFLLLPLLLFTNIFSLPYEWISREDFWEIPQSRTAYRSYFKEYLSFELITGYSGPVDEIIAYLKPKVKSGDNAFMSSEGISVLFSLPNLDIDNPHTFYTDSGRIMTPQDLKKYKWVIFRSVCDIDCSFYGERGIVEKILDQNYRKITLPVFDYTVQNREEIPYHLFKTQTNYPRVTIYEKIR